MRLVNLYRKQNAELMGQLAEARAERDQALETHRRVVANESNHYDRYWSPPDKWISDAWLDEAETKMREALGDAFCDDAAAVMLTLIAEIRRFRRSTMDSNEPTDRQAVRTPITPTPSNETSAR